MDNTRRIHLEIAKATLKKLYAQYIAQGFLSVYFWGSILREEYIPGVSDIDVIGIVEDRFPLKENENLNLFLKENAPELYDFRINLIRYSELNGARPISHLAVVTTAPVMMLLFPEWEHVCGIKYHRSDFAVQTPTYKQAICLSAGVIKNLYTPPIQRGDFTKFKSFVKRLLYICHFIHQIKHGPHPFSYDLLQKTVSPQTTNILKLLFVVRGKNYKPPKKDQLSAMLDFLSFVMMEYCRAGEFIR